jgi:hypothetical protein
MRINKAGMRGGKVGVGDEGEMEVWKVVKE